MWVVLFGPVLVRVLVCVVRITLVVPPPEEVILEFFQVVVWSIEIKSFRTSDLPIWE